MRSLMHPVQYRVSVRGKCALCLEISPPLLLFTRWTRRPRARPTPGSSQGFTCSKGDLAQRSVVRLNQLVAAWHEESQAADPRSGRACFFRLQCMLSNSHLDTVSASL